MRLTGTSCTGSPSLSLRHSSSARCARACVRASEQANQPERERERERREREERAIEREKRGGGEREKERDRTLLGSHVHDGDVL